MSGDTFIIMSWGQGACYGDLVGRNKDAKHPTVHRTAPPPNVDSVEKEKPSAVSIPPLLMNGKFNLTCF